MPTVVTKLAELQIFVCCSIFILFCVLAAQKKGN